MKLELRGITKRFGALTANDHIDLTVEPGEIHSLLGENGAGKSTLMNVLYGLYQADEGDILLDDVVQHFGGPGDAMAAGIGMVHQHFMLIPVFTVAENVMLGHEQTSFGGRLDLASARQRVREISDRFGFDVNPDAIVEDLPVGVQQRVEIIKALSRDAKVLVFDEPTAVLTPQETDELMATMRQLRDAGTSIVFITHKLREVRAVADRITVVRLGKIVGTASPTATNEELASLMVGRAVELTVRKDAPKLGAEALVVQNLTVTDETGQVTVDDVSFTVRGGETLAIVGVQGNGQTELTEALVGLQDRVSGSVSLDGNELIGRSVRDILEAGVGFVPEDRSVDGLVKEFSIVLARELSRELSLFVAAQPTRGVDVGSIEFIHTRIVATRDSGIPVIVISTELDEATALADRIMVMYRGKVVGIVPGDTPRETLGLMMAGMIDETASEVAE
jgi:simple sugar transport system ATP-binding protein